MLFSDTHTIAQVLKTNIPINIQFKGVSTDTRKPMKGALFVALVGDNFDAHDYLEKAQKMGAVAAVVSKKIDSNLPLILVENTQIALADIAKYHLSKIKPTVIAITGSNGKTTTKNMLANILSLVAPTLKTQGNLNNHLGVPISLLLLEKKHRYAVIEMGANHLGEISYLRKIANPDVALVTNMLDAHIGEFGGFRNLVKAKGEIYSSNSKNIANTSGTFTGDISFGDNGDIFASDIKDGFYLNIFNKKIKVALQLIGKHNIENALAASACAHALGIDIQTIRQGLENTKAEEGRLSVIQCDRWTIINDTYNASPSSSKYALEALSNFGGKKIAVLGEMAELGDESNNYHIQIGQLANSLNIDYLYSYKANYGVKNFNNSMELLTALKQHSKATILFKASRKIKLEQIIKKLCV